MTTSTAEHGIPSPRTPSVSARTRRVRTTDRLLRRARDVDDEQERSRLVDEVVVLNMPVARSIAQGFRNKGLGDEDLEQVAYMALTRAAHSFDASRGQDFLAYAVPTIRGELKKHFRDSGWVVRPPRRIQELQGRIMAAREALTQRHGRSPRPGEIAEELGEDLEHVVEALAADGCFLPSSLDRTSGDDAGPTLGESLRDESTEMSAAEARVLLAPLIKRLSDRDRRILDLRFFRDATQQEIADDIGVTQMHVSRLLTRILTTMHDELEEHETAVQD